MKPGVQKSIVILSALMLVAVPLVVGLAVDDKDCGKLEGVIRDKETGQAIENVYVSVDGCNTAAMTSSSGRFFLNEIPAGNCVIKVIKKGYKNYEGEIQVIQKKTCRTKIELIKQPVQTAETS